MKSPSSINSNEIKSHEAKMRIVGEIPHSHCKITIFAWNQKYLLKIEQQDLEQVYKIPEMDVSGDAAMKSLISSDKDFLDSVINRFDIMRKDWHQAFAKHR